MQKVVLKLRTCIHTGVLQTLRTNVQLLWTSVKGAALPFGCLFLGVLFGITLKGHQEEAAHLFGVPQF